MKQFPQVNVWFDKGAHAGWDYTTLAEALSKIKVPKKQLESFQRGFYTGQVTQIIYSIQRSLHWMSTEQILTLGAKMQPLTAWLIEQRKQAQP